MKNFPVADLLDAVNSLGNFAHAIMGNGNPVVPEENYKHILNKIDNLVKICQENNLDSCSITVSTLLKIIQSASPGPNDLVFGPTVTWSNLKAEELYHFSSELSGRVRDTLSTRVMIEVKHSDGLYFNQPTPLFGILVDEKFPNSSFDIAEAGMCFALSRYTACVFHLMRAMEAAIQIMGSALGVTIVNSNGEKLSWGPLVSNIKSKIDSMNKGEVQDDWLKIHALLHSCNRAYRTKTAHPVDKYTEEEARAALNITRSFFEEITNLI